MYKELCALCPELVIIDKSAVFLNIDDVEEIAKLKTLYERTNKQFAVFAAGDQIGEHRILRHRAPVAFFLLTKDRAYTFYSFNEKTIHDKIFKNGPCCVCFETKESHCCDTCGTYTCTDCIQAIEIHFIVMSIKAGNYGSHIVKTRNGHILTTGFKETGDKLHCSVCRTSPLLSCVDRADLLAEAITRAFKRPGGSKFQLGNNLYKFEDGEAEIVIDLSG